MNGGEQKGGVLRRGLKLRALWLWRQSKEVLVDVRISEDAEVNIKIRTKKKTATKCLFLVSCALEDLQLEPLKLYGGVIGEWHVYVLNTQINNVDLPGSLVLKQMRILRCVFK
ncbi:hypothetical protein LUZ63_017261 [Rhynchospora breviuscula]|uniref:Uncharacterized protein n=1 Tax=Rhynchospora breviuscula TaxID=2022672 RepID=A0A9Q0HF94_9POAL|nr:hypothetical protein LUZ63_017261 [Rhynchospora breviuscula]